MARQLVEFRTPAAYAGVENYAHAHAGTEAGALAWFAIGYAHYLDAQYPAAIAAMQKAQPQIGELKDYTAFFIGNSYVVSNNPEESFAYLRDFGTRFPDSLYAHDAVIAYAQGACWRPIARPRPSGCWKRTARPPALRPNIFWAKPMCRTVRAALGPRSCGAFTTTMRPITPLTAPLRDLKKIPEAASLPARHLRRAPEAR